MVRLHVLPYLAYRYVFTDPEKPVCGWKYRAPGQTISSSMDVLLESGMDTILELDSFATAEEMYQAHPELRPKLKKIGRPIDPYSRRQMKLKNAEFQRGSDIGLIAPLNGHQPGEYVPLYWYRQQCPAILCTGITQLFTQKLLEAA
jgi:hypothetical protein